MTKRSAADESDVIILGCVSSKRSGPAKAKDLYIAPMFAKRRRYAESTGKPWFIFSAEHGIIDPEVEIAPYDVAMSRLPVDDLRAKGARAADQLEAAQAALGSSEEAGVLLPRDTEALLDAIRRLIPVDWAPPSFDEQRAALMSLGIENLEQVPGEILRLIDHLADPSPEPALRFAAGALSLDGAVLRPQQSKGDPWYFQVRHPKFSQVVAYAHPRPGEIRIEYRLPSTHDTRGVATARENSYGIVLVARDEATVDVAIQLLSEAIAN